MKEARWEENTNSDRDIIISGRSERLGEAERGLGLYLCCCVPFMHHSESSVSAPAP